MKFKDLKEFKDSYLSNNEKSYFLAVFSEIQGFGFYINKEFGCVMVNSEKNIDCSPTTWVLGDKEIKSIKEGNFDATTIGLDSGTYVNLTFTDFDVVQRSSMSPEEWYKKATILAIANLIAEEGFSHKEITWALYNNPELDHEFHEIDSDSELHIQEPDYKNIINSVDINKKAEKLYRLGVIPYADLYNSDSFENIMNSAIDMSLCNFSKPIEFMGGEEKLTDGVDPSEQRNMYHSYTYSSLFITDNDGTSIMGIRQRIQIPREDEYTQFTFCIVKGSIVENYNNALEICILSEN